MAVLATATGRRAERWTDGWELDGGMMGRRRGGCQSGRGLGGRRGGGGRVAAVSRLKVAKNLSTSVI